MQLACTDDDNAAFQDFQRLIEAHDAITKEVQAERIACLAPELPGEVLTAADLELFMHSPCALHQDKLNRMHFKVDATFLAAGDEEKFVLDVLDWGCRCIGLENGEDWPRRGQDWPAH